jgi:hypothetical protein
MDIITKVRKIEDRFLFTAAPNKLLLVNLEWRVTKIPQDESLGSTGIITQTVRYGKP